MAGLNDCNMNECRMNGNIYTVCNPKTPIKERESLNQLFEHPEKASPIHYAEESSETGFFFWGGGYGG